MNKRKVLIVDDEAGFTKVVKLTLEASKKYEVREQSNPLMALQTARQFQPDVILLDVVMPQIDGGDVFSMLQSDPALKHIPVVFVTATVRKNEVPEHGGVIGGSFFVAKPVSAQGLMNCIEDRLKH